MFTRDLLGDKRILVTGGGTGLGKSMSRRFLELGASVVICGRRQNVLDETATELAKDFADRITSHVCDIRDPSQIDEMVRSGRRDRSMRWSTTRRATSSRAPRR